MPLARPVAVRSREAAVMKIRKSIGERTLPCATPVLSWIRAPMPLGVGR